ncbi:cell division protein ZapA [Roseococcus sp. DSY-14]|uniref:cell division protein ZapA n=1 Tax=Roseococcus sp. DSY-14 TaxID=3369650 RepID=UPI00387B4D94
MGQVTVKLNGYTHTIGCQDGEEDHVRNLVQQLEEKVRAVRSMGGQWSEQRMLLHVALLLADEGHDLRAELQRLRAGQPPASVGLVPPGPALPPADPRVAERLAALAERIEAMGRSIG